MVQSMARSQSTYHLTLRLFFTTLIAVLTVNLLDSDKSLLPDRGFIDLDIPHSSRMTMGELGACVVIGIVGGIIGAGITWVNLCIQKFRKRNPKADTFWVNLTYLLIILTGMISIATVLSVLLSCTRYDDEHFPVCVNHPERCLQLACPDQHFSEVSHHVQPSHIL